jgi:hypothetical protein
MTLQACAADEGPASEVRAASTPSTLSMRMWDLDWRVQLPWNFDDVIVECGTLEEVLPFVQEHYPSIFGVEQDRFFVEAMTEAKLRFWREMDLFVFRSEGAIIGIAAAHPTDWSTYYVRTLALLPEYRERRVTTGFAQRLRETLRQAGVARWEAECSPANPAMIRLFVREGLLVTATVTSERWGSMLRFTKFIEPEAERTFRKQFVYVPAIRRRSDSE